MAMLSYYGNLLPYLASYYHARQDQVSINVPMLWPSSVFRCAFSASMIITSPLELKFGIRPCMVASLILLWVTLICPYFAVKEPLALTIIFGGAQGLAGGILYSLALKLSVITMTDNAGLATGLFCLGPIIGSIINIALSFGVINPKNKKPDVEVDNVVYFSDQGMIDRVPTYLLISGLVTVAYTGLGIILAFIGSSNSGPSSENEKIAGKQSPPPRSHLRGHCVNGTVITDKKSGAEKTANGHVDPTAKSEHDKLKDEKKTYKSVSYSHNLEPAQDEEKQVSPKGSTGSSKLLVLSELSPKEALKTGRFWVLWLCYLCTSHTNYVHQNLYKQYGQRVISNDSVLVTTGLISMAGTLIIRPSVGIASDKFGIRKTTMLVSLCGCLFIAVMVISLYRCPGVFIAFVVLEFLCANPQTLIFSLLATFEFGKTHCASNLGLISSGNIVLILLEPFIVSAMVSAIGWDWVFITAAIGSAFGMVGVMLMEFFWSQKTLISQQ